MPLLASNYPSDLGKETVIQVPWEEGRAPCQRWASVIANHGNLINSSSALGTWSPGGALTEATVPPRSGTPGSH